MIRVDLDMGHGWVGRDAVDTKFKTLPAMQVSFVVIVKDVENNVFGWCAFLFTFHSQV